MFIKESNILFITYEEMKKDLASVIRKTASFLDKKVPEDRMADLIDHLSLMTRESLSQLDFVYF